MRAVKSCAAAIAMIASIRSTSRCKNKGIRFLLLAPRTSPRRTTCLPIPVIALPLRPLQKSRTRPRQRATAARDSRATKSCCGRCTAASQSQSLSLAATRSAGQCSSAPSQITPPTPRLMPLCWSLRSCSPPSKLHTTTRWTSTEQHPSFTIFCNIWSGTEPRSARACFLNRR